MDIAQRNINSGFDLAKSLAGAKNLAEVIELQAAHWRKQFSALAAQAEEVRMLSTQVTADAAKPIKEQVTRGVDELGKAS
jgi:phasin family protein